MQTEWTNDSIYWFGGINMIRKDNIGVLALMTVGLLSTQFAGCGSSQSSSRQAQAADQVVENIERQDEADHAPADSAEIEQAAQHMLTVWSDHMDVLEKMYDSELWALDYVEGYLESGDWNDLVKARTACIASARYLTELSMTEFSMTENDLTQEEYLILAEAGVDTSYQTVEFMSVPVYLDQAHNIIRNQLLEGLEYDVYFENLIQDLREQVLTERESVSVMSKYACIETNYLLLTLGDYADSHTYWSSMKENYPVLTSECTEWLASETELEAAASACMDEYESTVLRQSELVSRAEAALYQMTQMIENEDLEALSASVHTMVNVPELLPFPTWYSPHTTGYLSVITGEDGSVAYPESGDDLEDASYGMYMKVENVTEEEIADYIGIAKNYALDAWKSEDSGSWYIRMPDYNVKIDCEEDTAAIFFSGEDVTFAPVWYIGQ